ncbi:hypothetical protein Agub_g14213 [Astrephomene gubernaculifera]|uniref:Uncharacterized protein n=1 Tax=Astrephomene gubernaculifera TaxID=47775 RepID=A0AAD3E142_9CHLO|nr:hypothetical protein Agub_g14213 [Astrephomene gubernaculifera]
MAAILSRSCQVLPIGAARCPLAVALPRCISSRSVTPCVAPAKIARRPLACRASAEQPNGSTPSRHAVLHDFCMCIPYGALAVVAGVALFFLKFTNIAGTAIVAGATSLAASYLSLQEWKNGGSSTTYTLTSAASAAFVAYTTYTSLPSLVGIPYWLSVLLCGFSVAAAAFCAYNVVAGGNPPPKKGGADKKSKY